MFSVKNNVVVIVGGNGYLGRRFCKLFLKAGAYVYSCDMNAVITKETRSFMRKYPRHFYFKQIDAGDKQALKQLRNEILAKRKKVDVLINSTTVKGDDFYLPFEEVSLEGWDLGLRGDLTIPFLTAQAFVPVMKKQKKGSIINIASLYGLVGNDQRIYKGANLNTVYTKKASCAKGKRIFSHGVYNAAKGGLINFTKYLAAYYGEYNIRVNCVSPGGIYHKEENKEFVKKYSEKVPLGRKANPEEINGAVLFLASDASSYVTGHNLVVDGGYTAW